MTSGRQGQSRSECDASNWSLDFRAFQPKSCAFRSQQVKQVTAGLTQRVTRMNTLNTKVNALLFPKDLKLFIYRNSDILKQIGHTELHVGTNTVCAELRQICGEFQ